MLIYIFCIQSMKNHQTDSILVTNLTKQIIEELYGAVIFVGSYVSVYKGTNVPSGAMMTQSMFQYLFDDTYSENIILLEEYRKIPFEALMEMCPNTEKVKSAIVNLYGCNIANPVHNALIKLLTSEKFESLITPNYDLCFDSIISKDSNVITVIDESDFEKYNSVAKGKCYFKIHGSAESNFQDTLIYTLRQEGALPNWKKQLLSDLLSNKVILFIGYSGRDFDICPLIAEEISYKKIYWLSYKGDLSAYADLLIKSKEGNQILKGDLVDLLNIVYKMQIKPEKADDTNFSPKDNFFMTEKEILLWRINILDRLGFSSIGLKECETHKEVLGDDYYLKMRSAFLAHQGRYADAKFEALKRTKLSTNQIKEHLDAFIQAAAISIPHGSYLSSFLLQQKFKKRLRQLNPEKFNTFNSRFILISFTYKMRLFQILKKLPPLFFLLIWVKRNAQKNYSKAYDALRSSGSWDDRQMLQHNAERLNIPTQRTNVSLPSNVGFINLGMSTMDIIRYRDFLRFGPKDVQMEMLKRIDEYIVKAELLGIKTEVWKLCRIKLLLNRKELSGYQKLKCFSQWRRNLNNTQYVGVLHLFYKIEYWIVRLRLHYFKL